LRQPTDNTYTWAIGGETIAQQSCLLSHRFPAQGTYEVELNVSGPNAAGPFTQEVTVRDMLIVSIGDSYASGEGNPDVNRSGDQPAQWVDRRCHRSANSGPAQAAAALERADPHTSVTFLSFACSGATVNRVYRAYSDACPGDQPTSDTYKSDAFDPYKPGDPDRPIGSGVVGSYQGAEPSSCSDFADHLPPQIEELARTVGDRRVDALIASAAATTSASGRPKRTLSAPATRCSRTPAESSEVPSTEQRWPGPGRRCSRR
jgi:hypothetical protein